MFTEFPGLLIFTALSIIEWKPKQRFTYCDKIFLFIVIDFRIEPVPNLSQLEGFSTIPWNLLLLSFWLFYSNQLNKILNCSRLFCSANFISKLIQCYYIVQTSMQDLHRKKSWFSLFCLRCFQIYFGGPTPRGSQKLKIGFFTHKTTHSAKISFVKKQ